MRRVAIVGCAGSGKSTLARAMGERLDLPVLHLDILYWRAGWRAIDDREMGEAVDRVAETDRWITDGLQVASSVLRFQRADTIIWLDLPIPTCLRRAVWRVIRDHGRTRADLADGCLEKFDLTFYRWIWNFNRDVRPRLKAALEVQGLKAVVVRLTSDGAVAKYLAGIEHASSVIGG